MCQMIKSSVSSLQHVTNAVVESCLTYSRYPKSSCFFLPTKSIFILYSVWSKLILNLCLVLLICYIYIGVCVFVCECAYVCAYEDISTGMFCSYP